MSTVSAMQNASKFWSQLIECNKRADALIERSQKASDQSEPTCRETPFLASIEVMYSNVGTVTSVNNDAIEGINLKRQSFVNGGARVYVREICFESAAAANTTFRRTPNNIQPITPNFRWNFYTSITQRRYSPERGCLFSAGGRSKPGSHLSFREPLIVEPRESLVFECELLSSMSQFTDNVNTVISMIVSGYREGV